MSVHPRAGLVLLAVSLGGCPAADDSGKAADDTGFCGSAPVVTYESFGSGFMTENCQTCHASTAPDRHGAPEDITFDDVASCWEHADRILARSAGAKPTMPPMGGTTEDDRYLLEVWLTCATSGT